MRNRVIYSSVSLVFCVKWPSIDIQNYTIMKLMKLLLNQCVYNIVIFANSDSMLSLIINKTANSTHNPRYCPLQYI